MDYLKFKKEVIEKNGLKAVGDSFTEKSLKHIASLWDNALFNARTDRADLVSENIKFFKLIISFSAVTYISFLREINILFASFIAVSLLIFISFLRKKIRPKDFFYGGFNIALFLAFLLGTPAIFNLFSHQESELVITLWRWDGDFSLFRLPDNVGITREGINSLILTSLRIISSVSLILWSLLSMSFTDFIQFLLKLRIPAFFVQIISMTFIFLHLFIKRTEEVHLARMARIISKEKTLKGQEWVGTRIARAWSESSLLMEEVHYAMKARGFGSHRGSGRKDDKVR